MNILRWHAPLAACTVLGLLGCDGGGAEHHSTYIDDLVTQSEAELHDVADFPLPVCFRPEGDGTTAQRLTVQGWVEEAWEGLPRSAVSFSRWDTCTDNDAGPGVVKINLDSSFGKGLTSGGGWNVQLPTVGSAGWRTYTAIHEFGHVLGIHHEQLHPDKPADCTDGQAGEMLEASDLILTEYDPGAALNYCAPNPQVLSDKEWLFAQMAYPSNVANHLIRASGSLDTGNGMLVPANAVLLPEWTARGALPAAFSDVRWLEGGTWHDTITLQLGASGGPSTIDYEFDDFRGVTHTGAARSVTIDSGKFAGIVSAIL
jgi:hypothetical protein